MSQTVGESTTIGVASRCPRCDQTGEHVSTKPTAKPGYKAHIYRCTTKLCQWFSTNWVVTEDPDGKVPVRDIGHIPKSFPTVPKISEEQRHRLRTTFDDVDE